MGSRNAFLGFFSLVLITRMGFGALRNVFRDTSSLFWGSALRVWKVPERVLEGARSLLRGYPQRVRWVPAACFGGGGGSPCSVFQGSSRSVSGGLHSLFQWIPLACSGVFYNKVLGSLQGPHWTWGVTATSFKVACSSLPSRDEHTPLPLP